MRPLQKVVVPRYATNTESTVLAIAGGDLRLETRNCLRAAHSMLSVAKPDDMEAAQRPSSLTGLGETYESKTNIQIKASSN